MKKLILKPLQKIYESLQQPVWLPRMPKEYLPEGFGSSGEVLDLGKYIFFEMIEKTDDTIESYYYLINKKTKLLYDCNRYAGFSPYKRPTKDKIAQYVENNIDEIDYVTK